MKLRSYLKGLGLGIFVTALILSLGSDKSRGNMSDDEIRKRAAELGMISENSMLLKEAQDMADSAKDRAAARVSENAPEKEAVSDASALPEGTVSAGAVSSNGEIIYEKPDPAITAKEDSAATAGSTVEGVNTPSAAAAAHQEDEQPASVGHTGGDTDDVVTITVNAGDSSISVASKMADAGLVTDAHQFDSYLVLSGYDRRLVIGSHPIPRGASAAEMGEILTTKQ